VLVLPVHLLRLRGHPNSSGSKKSVWLINTDQSLLIFGVFMVQVTGCQLQVV
jgi:hypothetical protein